MSCGGRPDENGSSDSPAGSSASGEEQQVSHFGNCIDRAAALSFAAKGAIQDSAEDPEMRIGRAKMMLQDARRALEAAEQKLDFYFSHPETIAKGGVLSHGAVRGDEFANLRRRTT
jgi:hypothetical protein